jgi:hypothetical protein
MIQIGRLGAAPLVVDPNRISDGGSIRIAGRYIEDDPDLIRYMAVSVPALVAPDEPVVPVVFDESPAHLNGFYRVADASCDAAADALDSGYLDWDITLAPVPNRSAPAVESILDSVLRTNSLSITGATTGVDPMHAIPISLPLYSAEGHTLTPQETLDTETGDIRWYQDTTTLPFRSVATWACRPEHWYQGAATIERQWGATWLPAIGRNTHIPNASGGQWGITNGLIRLRNDPDAAPTEFELEVWGGSAWESATTLEWEVYSNPAGGEASSPAGPVTVIRNDPCEVRVRVLLNGYVPDVPYPPTYLDLRLRRGALVVEARFSRPNSSAPYGLPGSIAFNPNPTWTTFTGGRWRSSADAGGNRIIQLFPIAASNTTLTTWDTAVGFVPAGLSVVDEVQVKGAYFAPASEYVRVVGA